jgi:hypothetical protein
LKIIAAVLACLMSFTATAQSYIACSQLGGACYVWIESPKLVGPLYSGWTYEPNWGTNPQYWKDAMGMVHIRGLLQNPTFPTDGTIAFVLPEGYRPQVDERFTVDGNFSHATVVIFTNGIVQIWLSNPNILWLSLAGISFRAQ